MKVLLLSDANTSHTVKWARSLADCGVEISIFSLTPCDERLYKDHPRISLSSQGLNISAAEIGNKDVSKLRYLKALPAVRRLIEVLRPDIVHSHYASSYGLLGALSGFHPFILSVWGSDVYAFPGKSPAHEAIMRFNLSKADRILSTSRVMAGETRKYTGKPIDVTPFGIDLGLFKPAEVEVPFGPGNIVIGTIKTLEEKYGIEYLIEAFALLRDRQAKLPLKLLIVGGGSMEERLKALVKRLDLEKDAVFTGRVRYDDIVRYHNMLTVYVAVSRSMSESFGVAVIEAGACERPVVVSNIGGLPEVVEEGVTGFIVEPMNAGQTADAIEKLVLDAGLRARMGKAGRERVRAHFDWKSNVAQMMNIYRETLSRAGRPTAASRPSR